MEPTGCPERSVKKKTTTLAV